MPPMAKPLAQLIVVIELLVLNVAMSAVPEPAVLPGNVPGPVLQLLVVGAAIQLLLVGTGFQLALAAWARWLAARKADPTNTADSIRAAREAIGEGGVWFFMSIKYRIAGIRKVGTALLVKCWQRLSGCELMTLEYPTLTPRLGMLNRTFVQSRSDM
jgi:hypothetical protein